MAGTVGHEVRVLDLTNCSNITSWGMQRLSRFILFKFYKANNYKYFFFHNSLNEFFHFYFSEHFL